MKVPFEPIDSTESITAGNIQISTSPTSEMTTTQTYIIKQPDEYANDFMVNIKASDLRKVNKILCAAKQIKFPIHEILLGISTTLFGCFIGFIYSNITIGFNSFISIIIALILAIIFSSTFVAYVFLRKNNVIDVKKLSENIEEYIVNPDEIH